MIVCGEKFTLRGFAGTSGVLVRSDILPIKGRHWWICDWPRLHLRFGCD